MGMPPSQWWTARRALSLPQTKWQKPTRGADGIRMESLGSPSMFPAQSTLRASAQNGKSKMHHLESHSMVASKHWKLPRPLPLPACPIVTSALPTDRTCYLCRREGRRGCPLVARLPFAYIRTNGRFIPWKAESTQVPSPGRWPLARPDTYPTWEVALGLPGSWVSPAQVSYFIVAAAATLLE